MNSPLQRRTNIDGHGFGYDITLLTLELAAAIRASQQCAIRRAQFACLLDTQSRELMLLASKRRVFVQAQTGFSPGGTSSESHHADSMACLSLSSVPLDSLQTSQPSDAYFNVRPQSNPNPLIHRFRYLGCGFRVASLVLRLLDEEGKKVPRVCGFPPWPSIILGGDENLFWRARLDQPLIQRKKRALLRKAAPEIVPCSVRNNLEE